MRPLLGFLLIFCVIGAILLGVGAGIGFLLHWIIPAVDVGIGILIGVITISFTAQLFSRIISFPLPDLDDEPEPVETIIPPRITYLIDPPPSRRRGRRKPS